ncbi:MAG: tRNA pseudouridine synthase B [Deltaproteobacteria bacterium ADurb.Bin510]|nr:MAG: tRNA pseudouridine synthase B [Deltaproteobacteria bacterium ADurb.Bin510]
MDLDGLVLIDKPADMSSRQVVDRLRRMLGVRKAGHFGTLDPFATGLLCVALGQATKLLQFMGSDAKEYIATIGFEKFTDTDDLKGQTIANFENVTLDVAAAQAWLDSHQGWFEQVPPEYSAQKLNGQPLYKLKRRNIEVRPRPKPVCITASEILDHGRDWLSVRIACSRGTYIRSIARELGRELGLGGYLRELRRLKSEGFAIEQALTLEEAAQRAADGSLTVIALEQAHRLPQARVAPAYERAVIDGKPLERDWFLDEIAAAADGLFAVTGTAGRLICVARIVDEADAWARVERGFHP